MQKAQKKPKISDEQEEEEVSSFNFEPIKYRNNHRKSDQILKKIEEREESITYDGLQQFQRKEKFAAQIPNEDTIGFDNIKSKISPKKRSISKKKRSKRKSDVKSIEKNKETKIASESGNQLQKQDEISRILAMPSLRDRFEVMSKITTPQTMILHSKYKNLFTLFSEIDQMILFLNGRQQTPFFQTIQQNMNDSKKPKLELNQLKQILTIWPDCYQLSWGINEKIRQLDQMDLILNQKLNQTILDERKTQFKENMFAYLQSHGDFIPEAELPERPDEKRVASLDEYVKEKPRVTTIVQSVLKNLANQKEAKLNAIDFSKIKKVQKSGQVQLNQKLLDIVRKKEENMKLNDQKILISVKSLNQIASQIEFYYRQRQVSNMFLTNVVEYVEMSNKKSFHDQKQIFAGIRQLCSIVPQWLKLIESTNGLILRMDKNVDFAEIIELIKKQPEYQ